jgi:hypothetical protein
MSEGEHTIISKIPRERLNQIASRKLAALAIPVRLGADRETLEGELPFAGLRHPATDQPVARGRFAVSGHDHLRFLDPPLSALGPVAFYDLERVAALEQRVAGLLRERSAALHEVVARLSALRLEVAVDPLRLSARAVVRAPGHAFELVGGPEGVRVARVAPVGGTPFEVPPNFPRLRLETLGTPASLEAQLVASLPAMALARPVHQPPAPVAAATPGVEAMPAPRNAVTLAGLAAAFGNEVALAPNAGVELIQEFQHAGTRYRFLAVRETGTTFKGRLIGPGGDVWSDGFDLASFPGTHRVVALALGAAAGPADALASVEGAPASAGPVPPHLVPHPGEVWVMSVVVEQASGDEIRYVGTDIDGRPYGAARVLKRAEFEAVFAQERGGWRLLVQIEQVQGDQVVYRQLDRQREPIGSPRRLAAAILAANFVPEAAAS